MNSLSKTFADIGYHAVAEPDEYRCDFKVCKIISLPDQPLAFELAGDNCCTPTPDLGKAQVYLHGSVKWDGCSNWHFDDQESAMLHFCDREALGNVGALLQRLYDWAGELIPHWNG